MNKRTAVAAKKELLSELLSCDFCPVDIELADAHRFFFETEVKK